MSSSAQRIESIERGVTFSDKRDRTKVYFSTSGPSAISKNIFKNALLTTDLIVSGQVLRLALGCIIENRTTNSLETIQSWLNGSFNTVNRGTKQDYIGRDPVLYNGYNSMPTIRDRTDSRDLSYYFVQINTPSQMMFIGKVVRGQEVILGQKSITNINGDYGKLSFSCYQTGPQTVTISVRLGTPYSSLPYKYLEVSDSNNFLAAQEATGAFGIILGGGQGTNLLVTTRSKDDKFTDCGSGTPYVWEGANPTNPTTGQPSTNDPNPPQEGASTVISNFSGVTLSYDNTGSLKDVLRFNGQPISKYDRTTGYTNLNRLDLVRSGWGLVCAASDTRITAKALATGGNTDFPRTLILKKIDNRYISFLRLRPYGSYLEALDSTDGYFDPNSQKVKDIETILNLDINGDGYIGAPTIGPPTGNSVRISTVNGAVLSYDTTGSNQGLLLINNTLIKDQNGNNIDYINYLHNSYEAVAAGTINNNNLVVWKTPDNGVPFVKNIIEVFPVNNKLTTDPTNIPVTQTQLINIPIRFSYPVTGFTVNSINWTINGYGWATRNATVSGSGRDYVITAPSGSIDFEGLWEIRIFSSNIRAVINGRSIAMKQPSRLYWGLGSLPQNYNRYTSPTTNNPLSTTLVVWKMTSNWEYESINSIVRLDSTECYQIESNFGIDLNKDGSIGSPNSPPPQPPALYIVENIGNATLSYDQDNFLKVGNDFIVVDGSKVKNNNTSWEYLAAENIAGVNCLLSKSRRNGASRVIKCDPNWRSVSIDPESLPNTNAFFATETLFNIDIDRDGLVGRPLQPIVLPVMAGSNLVFSYDRSGEQTGLLKINDTLVKNYNNENIYILNYEALKWQPVAAGVVDGVNTIVWKYTENGYLHFWRLNSSWVQTSSDGYFAPGSPPFYAIETLFGLDFDNNNQIGAPTTVVDPPKPPSSTVIESLGSVTLAYNEKDELTANGVLVKFNNVPIKRSGTDWSFLAADNIDGTNTLLCQWRPTGYLHFLKFDNNWNSNTGSGWYSPNSSDFLATELLFQTDIDKNGIVGPSISLQSNFEEALEAISNQTIPLSVTLTSNFSSDTTIRYLWQYDTGSGWTDWTLPQTDSRTSSTTSIVFLPTYTTLKVRCKISILFAPNSLALSVFGGNYILTSKELTVTKKAETNYIVVRSPSPLTFTYNRGSSFSLDSLPQYVQDNIAIITGGDLDPDYITGIPSSWTPLCRPLETANCNAQKQAIADGVYGTRLLKSGLTYTLYPRTLSFRPFIMDFENLS